MGYCRCVCRCVKEIFYCVSMHSSRPICWKEEQTQHPLQSFPQYCCFCDVQHSLCWVDAHTPRHKTSLTLSITENEILKHDPRQVNSAKNVQTTACHTYPPLPPLPFPPLPHPLLTNACLPSRHSRATKGVSCRTRTCTSNDRRPKRYGQLATSVIAMKVFQSV